jgi:hypothetical protein
MASDLLRAYCASAAFFIPLVVAYSSCLRFRRGQDAPEGSAPRDPRQKLG